MSWASSRRTLILVVIFSIVAAVAAVTLIATLYETPSCSDGKRNQDEEGIDCGGTCLRVCSMDAADPVVSFVRPVEGIRGRTDVIAFIENPNGFAAVKQARYTIELYGEDRTHLAAKEGVVDLPPGSGTPLYVPNVYTGTTRVSDAFLTFNDASLVWYRYTDTRPVPRVGDVALTDGDAPYVSATLRNAATTPLTNVLVVATIFDVEGNVIAGTQTVVPEIPAQGSVATTLTFAASFSSTPGRIDVRPVLPLP